MKKKYKKKSSNLQKLIKIFVIFMLISSLSGVFMVLLRAFI